MICSSKKFCKPLLAVVIILLVVALLQIPPIHVGKKSCPSLHVDEFTLKNGMHVVLYHNARLPLVTHMLWYKVGAADDYPGRSGLAHYNEHMMFQGTQTTESGEFMKTISRLGGKTNAFTSRDATAYFVTIAKEQLPLVMKLEADRMINLAPTPEHFAKERDVIIEERRMRIDNQPEALLGEEMQALLYRNHPYRVPTIGWMQEMQGLKREDVLAFHKQFYHPSNAVLVVVGDVTRKDLEKLAEQYYGPLPTLKPYVRNWAQEPEQRGARHTELRHVNVREPQFSRIYDAPTINGKDKDAVIPGAILAQVLGGGSSSRLYQSLVVQQKIATDVNVGYDGFSVGPGQFEVYAHPSKGVTLLQLEAAIDKELAQAAITPPTADELARAKTLLKAETIFARDGTEGMARTLGMLITTGLAPSYFSQWPELVEAVTAEQVAQSAKLMLQPVQSVTGYLLPQEPAQKEPSQKGEQP